MKILKIINRIFVPSETFEKTIFFYEQLANQKCHLRFKYDEAGLELAQVDSFLIISGEENAVDRFIHIVDHYGRFPERREKFFGCTGRRNIGRTKRGADRQKYANQAY